VNPPDEGFLARMMRPTTSSAGKVHGRAVAAQAARGGTTNVGHDTRKTTADPKYFKPEGRENIAPDQPLSEQILPKTGASQSELQAEAGETKPALEVPETRTEELLEPAEPQVEEDRLANVEKQVAPEPQ
jgi:hypothetical protein